ncbi:MAG: BmrU protein, partial [Oscillospiraceae bacterium]|nr:BmrU protein [Oscillospiraceae bacterium]
MKHVFIINPTAGKKDCTARVMEMAKGLAARHGLDLECILTKSAGHATETARSLAQSGQEVRIYACGGDGTVNEAANGVAGYANAAMTCIPVGTGNDFLKNFGDMAPLFADPENLWDGPVIPLDTIDCNGRLALTVACSGLDAQVAHDVHKYGSSPVLRGQGSYIASLVVNFFSRENYSHRWTVTLDGEEVSGEFMLAAVCNGRYYGGGFMPSAEARMNDGVLNTIVVKKVSRAAFLRLVGPYSKGEVWRFPEIARRSAAKTVVIQSESPDIVT